MLEVDQIYDLEKVLAWLDTKDPDEVVGVTGRTRECPFHTYLVESQGLPSEETYVRYCDTLHGEEGATTFTRLCANPRWVEEVIWNTDGEYRADVTAKQFRKILEEVTT